MIRDPLAIAAILLGIQGIVLGLAEWQPTARFFRHLPAVFWIYFLPMLADTAGLLPAESPLYDGISRYLLPACLVLLLISVDIRAILRLGPIALGVMLAGAAGMFAGAVSTYAVFHPWLPAEAYKGFGALCASWIGGSANLLAVVRATDAPKGVYGPIVIVDTVVPYAWMVMLIFLAPCQRAYDRWNRSRRGLTDDLVRRAQVQASVARPLGVAPLAVVLALAAAVTAGALWAGPKVFASLGQGRWAASLGRLIDARGWAILLATTAGIALSFTPARRLEEHGASKLGYVMLYFVLTSIGAQTSLAHIAAAPLLLVAGVLWVCLHGAVLLAAGRLLRAPMSLLASASQANIGGLASAPVLADIYEKGLAPVGLLLAVLGNILGTYAGLACAAACAWIGGP